MEEEAGRYEDEKEACGFGQDIHLSPAGSWTTPQPRHNRPPLSPVESLGQGMLCALAELSVLELHLAAPFHHTLCYSILSARGHGRI